MSDKADFISRRAALSRGALTLAGIAVTVIGVQPAFAKAKAKKEDFYFQETPDVAARRRMRSLLLPGLDRQERPRFKAGRRDLSRSAASPAYAARRGPRVRMTVLIAADRIPQ
jgi:hypothetical protein